MKYRGSFALTESCLMMNPREVRGAQLRRLSYWIVQRSHVSKTLPMDVVPFLIMVFTDSQAPPFEVIPPVLQLIAHEPGVINPDELIIWPRRGLI